MPHEGRPKVSLQEFLSDPVLKKLLERSSLTSAQFESFLLDQLGMDMALRKLKRVEMARFRKEYSGVSRGSFNRTLKQGRTNVSEAIHTVILLGYCGFTRLASLFPLIEASERLHDQVNRLRQSHGKDDEVFDRTVKLMLDELETAYLAIMGKTL